MEDIDFVKITKGYRKGDIAKVTIRAPQMTARLAIECIGRWGMVVGTPDGEDSSGRMKMRHMTPDELVERACIVSEKAIKKFEEKNWLLDVPMPDLEEEE